MTVQFIRNEAPGYCVLITFYQFIKAMHMSYNEFVNTFPGTPPKELFDKRMPGWWDGIHSGRMKYPELKRVFFRPDGEGVEMYDVCDPFLEGIFKIQSGLDIHQVINKTKNFDKDIKNYWDDNKMEAWYDAYRDRCQEVPFVCCWLNFMHKKFTWPDHVYLSTLQDDLGKRYRIRCYNSDSPQGVVETTTDDMLDPLMFGTTHGYPKEDELPFYDNIKPGGTDLETAKKARLV